MEINRGTKIIKNNTLKAIAEITINDYRLFVFPGSISENDFLVKYSKPNTKIRTPKHIHWVADILMKMQADPMLTKSFLIEMKDYWDKCKPLKSNNYDNIKGIIKNVDVNNYSKLNDYGEYDMEFIVVLMKLLAVQEKTNRADAYMFGSILEELLKDQLDLFKVVSTAGFSGR